MKVWFGTTTLKYKKYKNYYQAIREYLLELGCVLTDDWIGNHGEWIEKNPTAKRGINKIYNRVMKAVSDADVSIIEFTVPNFSSSYQITHCLYQKKPVLVMRLEKDNTFADSFIEGLDSPYLTIKNYTMGTYKEIIDEFLGYSRLEHGAARYNIVLDRKQKHYLDWAANKYGKSRSEIIRGEIDKELEKDEDYKKYLSYV